MFGISEVTELDRAVAYSQFPTCVQRPRETQRALRENAESLQVHRWKEQARREAWSCSGGSVKVRHFSSAHDCRSLSLAVLEQAP